jgi:hypothetical protein
MNSLKTDLTDRVVVLREEQVTGTNSNVMTRIFLCKKGSGCRPLAKGAAIEGQFLGNRFYGTQTVTIDGSEDILRLAQQREIDMAQL